jgi:transposase
MIECSKCGCAMNFVRKFVRLRVPVRRFECDHCHNVQDIKDVVSKEMKTLEYPRVIVECPYCHSTDTYVTSSPRPWRYHKCRGCNETFNSVEKDLLVKA